MHFFYLMTVVFLSSYQLLHAEPNQELVKPINATDEVAYIYLPYIKLSEKEGEGQTEASQAHQKKASPCSLYAHSSFLNIQGIAGLGYGHDNKRATSDFFLPLTSKSNLRQLFVDLRGHYLSNNKWAGNAGLGLRGLQTSKRRVWGSNVYYDFREGYLKNYHQIGLGLESLGKWWDFRANGYLPIGDRAHSSSKTFDDYIGGFVMRCKKIEYAFKGANAEVGRYKYLSSQKTAFLYAAVGPYYFVHEDCAHFWGGSARIRAQYKEYVSAEVIVTYDQEFHLKTQGILTLSFPFNKAIKSHRAPKDSCRGLLWQPVVRKDIIVLDRDTCWDWNF